jgi:hypothetical protein
MTLCFEIKDLESGRQNIVLLCNYLPGLFKRIGSINYWPVQPRPLLEKAFVVKYLCTFCIRRGLDENVNRSSHSHVTLSFWFASDASWMRKLPTAHLVCIWYILDKSTPTSTVTRLSLDLDKRVSHILVPTTALPLISSNILI